jgi:hypothetical protein
VGDFIRFPRMLAGRSRSPVRGRADFAHFCLRAAPRGVIGAPRPLSVLVGAAAITASKHSPA